MSRPRMRPKKRSFGGNRFRRPMGPEGEQPMQEEAPLAEGEEVPTQEFSGILEMHPNGYGFLRSPSNNYSRERTDPFVPGTMIE
ncbi:MAG: transcription termination factor Rho, partial [Pirellulaceae bacterium]